MGLPDEHSRAAFDRLIVDHITAALRFATRLCGDVHEAEDIVQDALLRATRFRDSFRAESKFSTWLFRIVINVFRDRVTRMRIADAIDEAVADTSADPVRDAG